MNHQEKKLTALLKRMSARGHVISVKAEFEAEGTRSDELLRLLAIASSAQVPLTLKIGGCEALNDLHDARQVGAGCVVAPMIESTFALQKYVQAVRKTFLVEELSEVEFLFNIETVTAYRIASELVAVAEAEPLLAGIVFGRSDYAASLGPLARVTDAEVFNAVLEVAAEARRGGLEYGVGGALSLASIETLKQVAEVHLTRFETRKVVFHAGALGDQSLSDSLMDAAHFEILWLLNKRDYYGRLGQEDEARIRTMEERWGVLERTR